MRAWSQAVGNGKVLQFPGEVQWYQDPEYWENFAGYLTQQSQSDVLIYSSSSVIDKLPLGLPTKEQARIPPDKREWKPRPSPLREAEDRAIFKDWKPANPTRHYKKQWQKRNRPRHPRRARSEEAQRFRDLFTNGQSQARTPDRTSRS